jgi:hypothetical protein
VQATRAISALIAPKRLLDNEFHYLYQLATWQIWRPEAPSFLPLKKTLFGRGAKLDAFITNQFMIYEKEVRI